MTPHERGKSAPVTALDESLQQLGIGERRGSRGNVLHKAGKWVRLRGHHVLVMPEPSLGLHNIVPRKDEAFSVFYFPASEPAA
jgi:hypothetical protein